MDARVVVPGVMGAAAVGLAAAWWLRDHVDAGRDVGSDAARFGNLVERAAGSGPAPEAPTSLDDLPEPREVASADRVPPKPARASTMPGTASGPSSGEAVATATGTAAVLGRAATDAPAPVNSGPVLRPRAWLLRTEGCPGYELRSDATTAWNGTWSARLDGNPGVDRQSFCPLLQVVSAAEFAGRRVEFVVHLRTEGALVYATGWLRANDVDGSTVAFDNALVPGRIPPRLDSPWTRQTIVMDVPGSAAVLTFGAYLKGPGTLWVDTANLRVVDPSTPLTRPQRPVVSSVLRAIDPSTVPATLQNPDFEQVVEVPRRPRSQ